jgi:hypothetical protein
LNAILLWTGHMTSLSVLRMTQQLITSIHSLQLYNKITIALLGTQRINMHYVILIVHYNLK